MRRLLVLAVLLIVCIIAVGYYRDWFTISTTSDTKAVDVHVTVDKEKVKADEEKAKEKLGAVRDQLKEKAGEATEKLKKGSSGPGKPPDKP